MSKQRRILSLVIFLAVLLDSKYYLSERSFPISHMTTETHSNEEKDGCLNWRSGWTGKMGASPGDLEGLERWVPHLEIWRDWKDGCLTWRSGGTGKMGASPGDLEELERWVPHLEIWRDWKDGCLTWRSGGTGKMGASPGDLEGLERWVPHLETSHRRRRTGPSRERSASRHSPGRYTGCLHCLGSSG